MKAFLGGSEEWALGAEGKIKLGGGWLGNGVGASVPRALGRSGVSVPLMANAEVPLTVSKKASKLFLNCVLFMTLRLFRLWNNNVGHLYNGADGFEFESKKILAREVSKQATIIYDGFSLFIPALCRSCASLSRRAAGISPWF